MEAKAESSMAESAGSKGEISELPLPPPPPPPRGSSILAGKAVEIPERGEDEPARQDQDMVKLEAESSMDEYGYAGRKGKIGEKARLPPPLGLLQKAIDFLKRGKDKLARLYQREQKNGEGGPAWLDQEMIHVEAESVDHVILSFDGYYDGLHEFVRALYRCFIAYEIRTFGDGETLTILNEELRLLVSSSKIYIPIFSRTYAFNPGCLEMLALMIENTSRSGGKKAILPVFYDVERSDVQLGRKSHYRFALDTHKQSFGDEKVEQWRKALMDASKVKGWKLRSYKSEGELIKSIVGEISLKLKIKRNYVPEDISAGDNPLLSDRTSLMYQDTMSMEVARNDEMSPIIELESSGHKGEEEPSASATNDANKLMYQDTMSMEVARNDEMSPITELESSGHKGEEEPSASATNDAKKELEDSQESKIMELLELEVNDVRIVGIHGRDGIGKTALAKIVYDQISLRFDACSFLAEIEETMQQPGGVQYLQTKLIFDIWKREYEVASAFKGVRFLKEIFRNMKVFIVLDDVERESLLKEFVGAKLDWFGSGSRIIVTSKESRVLQGFVVRGLARTYDVSPMDNNRAFDLFRQYATRKSDRLPFYGDVAIKIVEAAKGLPLLVKVFGSFLQYKAIDEWNKFAGLIQPFQEDYQKTLSIIYDALDQKKKQMYLDIACFTPDVDCRIASYMWPRYRHYEIEVLCRMSLIKMEENKIGMHSMLRCHAREIIHKVYHDPGTGVGLHLPAIAQDTNKWKKGTDHLNTEEAGFEIPLNTTFLSLGRTNIGGQFGDTLMKVRWLHWQGCPRDAISIHLEKNENLVILDLSWSKVTESWEGWKRIKMEGLKVLNLTGCAELLVTPSFSCYPNLEILILERCSRLVHLDPSINDLKLLVTLNLKFCSELSMLPVEMDGMNALKELLIDGTSVRELPASIGNLVQLQILSGTNCSSLVRVPDSVCELTTALSVLALDDAKILELPKSIGDMRQLRRLSLRDCHGLGMLPESIGKLRYSLVELDISGTGISRLPDSIENLLRLELLKMDSCFLREFPRGIGGMLYLEVVHASWCRSMEGGIPSGICHLRHLRELRLRGTRISNLPSQIQNMSSLHTLDLLHCDLLKELPPLPSSLTNLYVNPDLMPKT